MVNGKDQVFQQLTRHSDALTGFGIGRVGLFGSFVRNEQTDESDVDIVVEFNPEKKLLRQGSKVK